MGNGLGLSFLRWSAPLKCFLSKKHSKTVSDWSETKISVSDRKSHTSLLVTENVAVRPQNQFLNTWNRFGLYFTVCAVMFGEKSVKGKICWCGRHEAGRGHGCPCRCVNVAPHAMMYVPQHVSSAPARPQPPATSWNAANRRFRGLVLFPIDLLSGRQITEPS